MYLQTHRRQERKKGEKNGTYNQRTGISVYFGMGFLREMNRKVTVPVDGLKDVKDTSV